MPLRDTQFAIEQWLRAPEGVAKALLDEDARQSGNEPGMAARRLSRMIQGDEALNAVGRLEIYANAYFQRIFGVLQGDYPALEAALGTDLFYDLITSYLLVHPSQHPSLRYAGARLSTFLKDHEAADAVRAKTPWASELAHLEWTRSEVFDTKDGPVLSQTDLATLAPEDFGALQLQLGPWVRRVAYAYPVADLWRPAIRGESVDAVDTTPTPVPAKILVWRKDEDPVHRILDEAEYAALAQAQTGIRFDALCVFAATRVADEDAQEEAPALAAGWLAQWLSDGLLQAA